MEIAKATVQAIMSDPLFPGLIDAYAAESAVEGLPSPDAKMATYLLHEASGALHAWAARHEGALVGFISLYAPPLLHYGAAVGVVESFYVAPEHRRGGTGLRLLAAAEAEAQRLGSPVLQVCAPLGGRLVEVLPRCGYRPTNAVFTKRLGLLAVTSPAMSRDAIDKVRRLEDYHLATQEQADLGISHVLHAGLYARTVKVPAGQQITGAMMIIPTMLILDGDCFATLGDEVHRVVGHVVLPASAIRKSAFRAVRDTTITMCFATTATTVEQAEAEFTDEAGRLANRREGAVNHVTITGDQLCLVS